MKRMTMPMTLSLHPDTRSVFEEGDLPPTSSLFGGNYWVAPDCHLLSMTREMKSELNGCGGDIDESWLYHDAEGASLWLSLMQGKFYSPIQTLDFNFVADVIYHHWKRSQFASKHIHVVGLGSGNAEHEIRLVHRMLDRIPDVQVSLYLFDMSPVLLNEASHATRIAFAKRPTVSVTLAQANFEKLSAYEPIVKLAQERNELIILPMFGFSFCTTKNDRLFVRNALRAFRTNTLFLADVLLATTEAHDTEGIRQKDSLLRPDFYFHSPEEIDFFISPLRRYRSSLQNIELFRELDYSTCGDGSYAIEMRAIVDEHIPFTVLRIRKYEPIKLANWFGKEGWSPLQAFPYGFEHDARMLYLLSKM